jgi:hypothetical protein
MFYKFDKNTLLYKSVNWKVFVIWITTLIVCVILGAFTTVVAFEKGKVCGIEEMIIELSARDSTLKDLAIWEFERHHVSDNPTEAQIRKELARYGLPSEVIDQFVYIAKRESNFHSDIVNVNENGSIDLGLLQLNSIHSNNGFRSGKFAAFDKYSIGDLLNWKLNIEAAVFLYRQSQRSHGYGFWPWDIHRQGIPPKNIIEIGGEESSQLLTQEIDKF